MALARGDVSRRVGRGAVRGPSCRRGRQRAGGLAGGSSRAPADHIRRLRPTCCWTGSATLVTDGLAAAAADARTGRAVRSAAKRSPPTNRASGAFSPHRPPSAVWDFESWDALSTPSGRARPQTRCARAVVDRPERTWNDRHVAWWIRGGGCHLAPRTSPQGGDGHPGLAVRCHAARRLPGTAGRSVTLIEATIADAVACGEGLGVTLDTWTTAVLDNGLGRYADALAAAERCERSDRRACSSPTGRCPS